MPRRNYVQRAARSAVVDTPITAPPTRLCYVHLGRDPGWWWRVTKYKPDEWLCAGCHPPDPDELVQYALTGGEIETTHLPKT